MTPSLVLVTGPEELLAERAVDQVMADLRVTVPDVELVTIEPAGYEAGDLGVHASPSLFGEDRAIVVRGLHEAGEALQQDLLGYLADPADAGAHRAAQRTARADRVRRGRRGRVLSLGWPS